MGGATGAGCAASCGFAGVGGRAGGQILQGLCQEQLGFLLCCIS